MGKVGDREHCIRLLITPGLLPLEAHGDDGIIKALEVAGFSLWGTELVVLSGRDVLEMLALIVDHHAGMLAFIRGQHYYVTQHQ
jgi:hypothetical protein